MVSWDENLYLVLSSLGSKIWAPKMWAGTARTRVSCIEPSHGGPLIWGFLKTPRQLMENHQAHVLEWNWHPVVLAWMTSLKESPWQRLLCQEFIWGTKSKEQECGAEKEQEWGAEKSTPRPDLSTGAVLGAVLGAGVRLVDKFPFI